MGPEQHRCDLGMGLGCPLADGRPVRPHDATRSQQSALDPGGDLANGQHRHSGHDDRRRRLAAGGVYRGAEHHSEQVRAWVGRFILVSSRSVNTIIWALLFVAIFGSVIVAGIVAIMFRSIGFLGKLLGEAIEEIDRKPVEALACGASRFKVVLYGIVPQVMPAFFAVAILRWDINLRESTVLGLSGLAVSE